MDVKRFTCKFPDCLKQFSKQSRMMVHQRSHTGERPYVCDVEDCLKTFKRVDHLRRHTYTSHRDNKTDNFRFQCDESDCEASFSSIDNLTKHVRVTHEKSSYRCHITGCGKEFRKHHQLRTHRLEDHQGTAYKCTHADCGKTFQMSSHLKRHLKTHEGYVCSDLECGEKFDKWSLLVKHRKVKHLAARVHQCCKCKKSFSQKQWLKQHMMVHETSRAVLICPHEDCGREYLDQRNLNAHVRSYHEGKKFNCEEQDCGRSFATKKKSRPKKKAAEKLTGVSTITMETEVRGQDHVTFKSPIRDEHVHPPHLHMETISDTSDLDIPDFEEINSNEKETLKVNDLGAIETILTPENIHNSAVKQKESLQTSVENKAAT
ncbi:TF3A-like protein [Mya arenaria]|uniref:TF3A-like protein n=1 Tax=Mya arenaria TaxID=6604 RepID=A0ABY7DLQ1_MYAAR|nr:TF3A-like protein [Mya arenaria]